jgi:hypothetical protein
MKKSNRIFSVIFGLLAFAEIIGFMTGRNWCFFAAIFCAAISLMFYSDSQPATKRKERRIHP